MTCPAHRQNCAAAARWASALHPGDRKIRSARIFPSISPVSRSGDSSSSIRSLTGWGGQIPSAPPGACASMRPYLLVAGPGVPGSREMLAGFEDPGEEVAGIDRPIGLDAGGSTPGAERGNSQDREVRPGGTDLGVLACLIIWQVGSGHYLGECSWFCLQDIGEGTGRPEPVQQDSEQQFQAGACRDIRTCALKVVQQISDFGVALRRILAVGAQAGRRAQEHCFGQCSIAGLWQSLARAGEGGQNRYGRPGPPVPGQLGCRGSPGLPVGDGKRVHLLPEGFLYLGIEARGTRTGTSPGAGL